MEKVEKNLVSNQRKGKNLIKASTILEITLEDYHQSRKLYGQGNSDIKFDKFKQTEEEKKETRENKYTNENLFDEFEEEANEFNNDVNNNNNGPKQRVSFSKLNNKNPQIQNNKNNNLPKEIPQPKNQTEKINMIKNIIFNYIKEKELDM